MFLSDRTEILDHIAPKKLPQFLKKNEDNHFFILTAKNVSSDQWWQVQTDKKELFSVVGCVNLMESEKKNIWRELSSAFVCNIKHMHGETDTCMVK